jgi:co-chaperonin GroES (HSP10)
MNTPSREQDMLGRRELELETTSLDNTIFVVAGKLGLEAIEDKILILIDKFKSGYECKDCNETGIYVSCECERRETPGRYISGNIDRVCRFCEGNYEERRGKTCPSCHGTGSTIIMPDNAKAIPTSGVIVSIGPGCKTRKIAERVLFSAHTGYFLPFKGNAKIRCMREDEPLCLIHAIDNTQTLGDFLQIEDSLETLNK